MTNLIIWAVVGIVVFAISSYVIGRKADPIEYDVANLIFAAAMISIFWPVALIALLAAGPLYLPYKLGTINRKKAEEKAKMWETLKK